MDMTKDTKFAQGICFNKIAICFILGSIIGVLYEELITIIKFGEYQTRRGVLYGPFNPLYGLAFISVIILFHKIKNPFKLFVIGVFYGMVFEILFGALQILILGSRSWDYTGQFLNIYGYTSPMYGIIWGIFILFIIKGLLPFVSKYIEKLPIKPSNIITKLLFLFLIMDTLLTITVLTRQSFRHLGYPPITYIGEWIDEVYTDEKILHHFPDMIHQEE